MLAVEHHWRVKLGRVDSNHHLGVNSAGSYR